MYSYLKSFLIQFKNSQEMKPTVEAYDSIQSNISRKRSGTQESSEFDKDEDGSGKRARSIPSVSEESAKESDRNSTGNQDDVSSTGPSISKVEVDSGPVQQLIAMFGALVAQGAKAVDSLEILISSISADLLAEVVMANLRNFPPDHSKTQGDDEPLTNMTIVGDSQVKYPPSFIANVLSLSSTFPPIASLIDAHQSLSNNPVVMFLI